MTWAGKAVHLTKTIRGWDSNSYPRLDYQLIDWTDMRIRRMQDHATGLRLDRQAQTE